MAGFDWKRYAGVAKLPSTTTPPRRVSPGAADTPPPSPQPDPHDGRCDSRSPNVPRYRCTGKEGHAGVHHHGTEEWGPTPSQPAQPESPPLRPPEEIAAELFREKCPHAEFADDLTPTEREIGWRKASCPRCVTAALQAERERAREAERERDEAIQVISGASLALANSDSVMKVRKVLDGYLRALTGGEDDE